MSSHETRPLLLIASLLAAVGFAIVPRPAGAEGREADLPSRARAILSNRCHSCHGANGVARKNVFVLDRERLVSSKVVVPGSLDSPLLKAVETGAMPLGSPELPEEEKAVLREWITDGAKGWEGDEGPRGSRASLSEEAIVGLIRADLLQAPARSRIYFRYFSLAHLYGAGASREELESHRVALSRLVNSLSWHREITAPVYLDPERTVCRIDLRDYNWTSATWDMLLRAYPYGLRSVGGDRVARLSGVGSPYVRADWFVSAASAPPLYHEVLGLPQTLGQLERLLGVDAARNIEEEKNVARAGVRNSGVSQNNRVLERHSSPFGAYWKSYDFRSNLEDQNVFKDPVRLVPAGSEIIFNLPNGLQAYFLSDAEGRRIDSAPIQIVSNRNTPDDPVIRNGRSCMSCHYEGVKSFKDDVRPVVSGLTSTGFDREKALALYPPQESLDRLMESDRERFRAAIERTGGRVGNNPAAEPINSMYQRFTAELSVAQAAAEAGLSPEVFRERLRASDRLASLGFGQLLVPEGGIKRDAWERAFREVASELRLEDIAQGLAGQAPGGFQPRGPLATAEPAELTRATRTVVINSRTSFLKPDMLASELQKRPEFRASGLVIVKDESAADLQINIDRASLSFNYSYSLTHRRTSVVLVSGKVTAWDGSFAAPKIAKEIMKRLQAARAPGRTEAKK
ncbi:MAG TPA: hypothetical protein VE262_25980 [Blastocatellia bacterium]|nr:hypothetical protein [Blastocatellia bacterium]